MNVMLVNDDTPPLLDIAPPYTRENNKKNYVFNQNDKNKNSFTVAAELPFMIQLVSVALPAFNTLNAPPTIIITMG
jgi:hypothetical protein